jgi:transcriptional regulator with XRE-family HTH domain
MSMKFYKSYSFVDKDPVIDTLRTAINNCGLSYDEVSDASGVSKGTLVNWFHGQTKRPQHATIMAVTRGIGYDWRLVRIRTDARAVKRLTKAEKIEHEHDTGR